MSDKYARALNNSNDITSSGVKEFLLATFIVVGTALLAGKVIKDSFEKVTHHNHKKIK